MGYQENTDVATQGIPSAANRVYRSAFARHPLLLPTLVGLLAFTATVLTSWYVYDLTTANQQVQFNSLVQRTSQSIANRLGMYTTVLRSGASLFAATEHVSREEFAIYVRNLHLPVHYPGILGVGFTKRVAATDIESLEAAMREAGHSDFKLWPTHVRDEYHTIIYLEPKNERNLAALGFDMFTEQLRGKAMARSRDTGTPTMTGAVQLVQEIDDDIQTGFLVYVPVYNTPDVPSSIEQRRELLSGFVYSPFRMDDFLQSILGNPARSPIVLEVFDDGTSHSDKRMAAFGNLNTTPRSRFTSTTLLTSNGNTWRLNVAASELFLRNSNRRLSPLVFAAGLFMTAILFLVSAGQARARLESEEAAEELRESEEAMRQMALNLARARDEAIEASKAKSRFLSNMSHELRTPLNAIIGYSEMLQEEMSDLQQEEAITDLKHINAASQHLLSLINHVLDLSRIEAGQMTLSIEPFPVRDMLAEVYATAKPLAEKNNNTLEIETRNELGEILADKLKVRQILLNLVGNACKFTDDGQVKIIVARNRTSEGEQILFEVTDTGIGIRPEVMSRLFQEFNQGDSSSTRRHDGTGLGLAISRYFSEMMGGEITVTSEPNYGSTFTLTLPVRVEPLPQNLDA